MQIQKMFATSVRKNKNTPLRAQLSLFNQDD
jgi:hypothetical protein